MSEYFKNMPTNERKFSSERSRWFFPNFKKEEIMDYFAKAEYKQGDLNDIPPTKSVVFKVY